MVSETASWAHLLSEEFVGLLGIQREESSMDLHRVHPVASPNVRNPQGVPGIRPVGFPTEALPEGWDGLRVLALTPLDEPEVVPGLGEGGL